jgi:hypothetical protein
MGGSKTAIFTQVVHFYSDGVDHITIGGNTKHQVRPRELKVRYEAGISTAGMSLDGRSATWSREMANS